jgi:hypothetical protein
MALPVRDVAEHRGPLTVMVVHFRLVGKEVV